MRQLAFDELFLSWPSGSNSMDEISQASRHANGQAVDHALPDQVLQRSNYSNDIVWPFVLCNDTDTDELIRCGSAEDASTQ